MSLEETLLGLEHALGGGGGDAYREHLREDAVVVVPGLRLDKAATVQAMERSPGWEGFDIEDAHVVRLAEDCALLTYRFTGRRRSGGTYVALMSSVYTRREGTWRMAFHQQTPLA